MVNSEKLWTGKVPDNWKFYKGKYIFGERSERGNSVNLQLLSPTQKFGVIPQSMYDALTSMKSVKVKENTDLSTFKTIHRGDFCISLRSFQGGFEYSKYEGVVSPAYHVLYPRMDICAGYYKYLFKEQRFIGEMNSYCQSLRDGKNISYFDFGRTLIPMPPLSEQQAIADYLDETCSKIDDIIAEAKASIDEYKELKQSVIFEAVTKGLDKNAEMKDSGVEWIGKTPFNWSVKKLGRHIEILPGYAFSSADFSDRGIRLLRGINVTPTGARWDDVVCWNKEISDDLKTYLLEEGDIVVGLDRPWISEGARIFIMSSKDLPCLLLQRVCRIRCKKIIRNEFLYYWLKSKAFEEALTTETTGISVPHISTNQIKDFKITFPSEIEQDTIIEYLNKRTIGIDSLIVEKESLINDLEAYKKSLIYEVVTGKRRVV